MVFRPALTTPLRSRCWLQRSSTYGAGSACASGALEPSHVLLAMGAGDSRARGSLRFSLGHTSTQHDVDALAAVIGEVTDRARRAAATR